MKGIKFTIKSEKEQQRINQAMLKLCKSSKVKMLKVFGIKIQCEEKQTECEVLFYISDKYLPFIEKITKNFENTIKEIDKEADIKIDFIL